jgi:hypothetical protein
MRRPEQYGVNALLKDLKVSEPLTQSLSCLLTVHYFLVPLSSLGTSNIYAENMTFFTASHNLFSYS